MSYHHSSVQSLPRPSTPPGQPPSSARRPYSKLSFGVVCSSNINRSMEAHLVLGNAGLTVESYGTGTTVRLPGRSAMEPRIFKFGTPYEEMYSSLAGTPEDEAFFGHNGVLGLCRRGAAVKTAPQRWQDTPSEDVQKHNVGECRVVHRRVYYYCPDLRYLGICIAVGSDMYLLYVFAALSAYPPFRLIADNHHPMTIPRSTSCSNCIRRTHL